jgi:hypothetical protein
MQFTDPLNFDIDVDVAPLLDGSKEPQLVSSRWYKLLRPSPERPAALQVKIERAFHNLILKNQWDAARARTERRRRRAVRAPLLSRLQASSGDRLVTTDISLAGLRCSGRPTRDELDVEFRLPGLAFPVEARARVVSFRDANVIPLAGLQFVDIDAPYLEHIHRYVDTRRRGLMAA